MSDIQKPGPDATVHEQVAYIKQLIETEQDPLVLERKLGIDPFARPLEAPVGRLAFYHGHYPILTKDEKNRWIEEMNNNYRKHKIAERNKLRYEIKFRVI